MYHRLNPTEKVLLVAALKSNGSTVAVSDGEREAARSLAHIGYVWIQPGGTMTQLSLTEKGRERAKRIRIPKPKPRVKPVMINILTGEQREGPEPSDGFFEPEE